MDKTSLGDRMKRYEKNDEKVLMRRVPVIVRVDGKRFSRWTKGFDKPFDEYFTNLMAETMIKTASNIEGCVFGYTQSDEMTFVLCNDQSLESEPWFGNRVQKIVSVVSSLVTAHFCERTVVELGKIAFFDARVFTVPNLDEAANALVWRQNDATKNSISAACYYEVAKKVGKGTARKMMHGLNQNQQQELLFQEVGINWNDYPTHLKRGTACYRETKVVVRQRPEDPKTSDGAFRRSWTTDREIPVFTKERDWLINRLKELG